MHGITEHIQPFSQSVDQTGKNVECMQFVVCMCNIVAWINVQKSGNVIFQQIINWRFLKCLSLTGTHTHTHNSAHTIYLGNGLRLNNDQSEHILKSFTYAKPIFPALFCSAHFHSKAFSIWTHASHTVYGCTILAIYKFYAVCIYQLVSSRSIIMHNLCMECGSMLAINRCGAK